MAMEMPSTMRPAGWSGELQDLQVILPTSPDENTQLRLCTQDVSLEENNLHGRPALDARRRQQYASWHFVRQLHLNGATGSY